MQHLAQNQDTILDKIRYNFGQVWATRFTKVDPTLGKHVAQNLIQLWAGMSTTMYRGTCLKLPNFGEGDRICRVPHSRKKFGLRIRSPRLVLLINEKRTIFRRHMLQRVFWQGQDLFVGTQVS